MLSGINFRPMPEMNCNQQFELHDRILFLALANCF